jgi:hypothetical protein
MAAEGLRLRFRFIVWRLIISHFRAVAVVRVNL